MMIMSNPMLMETYIDAFASSIDFYIRVNRAFIDAFSVPLTDAREELKEIKKEAIAGKDSKFNSYDKQQEFYNKSEKIYFLKYVINLIQTLEKKHL